MTELTYYVGKRNKAIAGFMAFAVVALVFALAPRESASAAPYPPSTSCALSVDATTVVPGDARTLSGSGFGARQNVDITVASASAGSATTDAGGSFTFRLHIPATLSGNSVQVVAASSAATCMVELSSASVAGQREVRPPSNGGLASTGFPVVAAEVIAVSIAALGLLFLTIGRRRRV